MKDKRRGFTLVELMVVLSILLLASVLISGILIQGYKVYNRTENYSVGEDQFRKAVMSIENVVEDYNSKDVFIFYFYLSFLHKSAAPIDPAYLPKGFACTSTSSFCDRISSI